MMAKIIYLQDRKEQKQEQYIHQLLKRIYTDLKARGWLICDPRFEE